MGGHDTVEEEENPIQKACDDNLIQRENHELLTSTKAFIDETGRIHFSSQCREKANQIDANGQEGVKRLSPLLKLYADLQEAIRAFRDETLTQEINTHPLKLLSPQQLQPKEKHFSFQTAHQLSRALNGFFYENNTKSRKKITTDFLHYSRQARFTRRTKTAVTSALFGIVFLAFSLGLIIGTGGIALMGGGAVFGVSLALGMVAAGIAGYVGYKYYYNPNEQRGKKIVEKLNELNNHEQLQTFISNSQQIRIGAAKELRGYAAIPASVIQTVTSTSTARIHQQLPPQSRGLSQTSGNSHAISSNDTAKKWSVTKWWNDVASTMSSKKDVTESGQSSLAVADRRESGGDRQSRRSGYLQRHQQT